MSRSLIPNSTQVPDLIFDEWMPLLLSNEIKIVLFVIRRTFGWGKRSEDIGAAEMVRGTGMARSTIFTALASLEAVKVLLVKHGTRGGTANNYALNIHGAEEVYKALKRRSKQASEPQKPVADAQKQLITDSNTHDSNTHDSDTHEADTHEADTHEADPPLSNDDLSDNAPAESLNQTRPEVTLVRDEDETRLISGLGTRPEISLDSLLRDKERNIETERRIHPPNPPSQDSATLPEQTDGWVVGLLKEFFVSKSVKVLMQAVRTYGAEECRWQMEGMRYRLENGSPIGDSYAYWLTLLRKKEPLLVDIQERRDAEYRQRERDAAARRREAEGKAALEKVSSRAQAELRWSELTSHQQQRIAEETDRRFRKQYGLFASRLADGKASDRVKGFWLDIRAEILMDNASLEILLEATAPVGQLALLTEGAAK